MAEIETTQAKSDDLYDTKIPTKSSEKKVAEKIVTALRKLAKRYDLAD